MFFAFCGGCGGSVGLKSVDSDVSDESFMGGKYVGTFVLGVPVLLESPIYSANENRFAIVKTVLLLYDLIVINYKRSNYGIYKNRDFRKM